MLIYMIRHGQTDWNADERFQGQQDIPLNETGRRQATGNGETLAHLLGPAAVDFDYVSSPLGRTRDTMERMRTAIGLPPEDYSIDTRLKEVCFGDWEGLTIAELEQLYPEKVAARAKGKWDFIPPGDNAESYEILSWRIGAWLNSLERPTICVSHGGVIRSVFRIVAKLGKDEACSMNIPQDKVLRIERDNGEVRWL